MDNIIDIHGIYKSYTSQVAVKNIDLYIEKGELFGIVGPDGAGKTTLMQILSCVIKPDRGEGTVAGFDFPVDTGNIKNNTGYLSQVFSLYRDLTVSENIDFFGGIYEVGDFSERKEDLLRLTDLYRFRNRPAGNLSGGMKQKLALICTLINTPPLILLDEPTTGVDPVSRSDFWKILSELHKSGITILVNISYLNEAERCSRVAFMDRGEFLAVDEPAKLKEGMKERIIDIYVDDMNKTFRVLGRNDSMLSIQFLGNRISVTVDSKTEIESMIKRLSELGIEIKRWKEVKPSLENVFISLMRREDIDE